MKDPLPSRYDDGHYDTCSIRSDGPCDCPASEFPDGFVWSEEEGRPVYSPQREDGSGERHAEAALGDSAARREAADLPHLERAVELLWEAGHPAVAEALNKEAAELLAALREEMAWDMGGVPENEWMRRTRHLRASATVAIGELERLSDVRVNRGAVLGNVHMLLSDALKETS